MGLFSKRSKGRTGQEAPDEAPARAVPEGQPGIDRDYDRAVDGPFDIVEADEMEGLLDLGVLHIPMVPRMQLRFDTDQETRRIVGLTCALDDDRVQVQAFAAPRSENIWPDIRADLIKGITDSGGAVTKGVGSMGEELITRLPSRTADGQVVYQPARFVGVDGPRWFVRAVVHGPAATQAERLAPWMAFLRGMVVDRGDEPKPPREVLALTAPPAAAAVGESSAESDTP